MITERDEIKCRASLEMIEASSLEPRTKADLKDSIEEAKFNLNGRTLEERVLSIAQNQFDITRFLADIIIQFKTISDSRNHIAEPGESKPAAPSNAVLKWISDNQFFIFCVIIIIAIQGGAIGQFIMNLVGKL